MTARDAPLDEALVITAYGTPVTQGSIRSLGAGRPSVHSNAKRLKPWRVTVKEAALDAMVDALTDEDPQWPWPLDGPVAASLLFCFARPAGHYGTGRNSGQVRPGAPSYPANKGSGDIEKLVRACFDALTDAALWHDDSQVVKQQADKLYVGDEDALDRPGVRIEIRPVTV